MDKRSIRIVYCKNIITIRHDSHHLFIRKTDMFKEYHWPVILYNPPEALHNSNLMSFRVDFDNIRRFEMTI